MILGFHNMRCYINKKNSHSTDEDQQRDMRESTAVQILRRGRGGEERENGTGMKTPTFTDTSAEKTRSRKAVTGAARRE
jgi:hypothetical protein